MARGEPAPERADASSTGLLAQVRQGDAEAENRFVAQVYEELRRLARRHMRDERAGHTLQPTALVNEAYLRLRKHPMHWQNRAQFFAAASHVMRQVLVDHARAKRSQKRGGGKFAVSLTEEIASPQVHAVDVLEVHEQLEALEKLDPQLSRLLELHYFGGLSFEEIAGVMHISVRTAKRRWQKARAWLRTHQDNNDGNR
ncbi:MAG: sigma-70 family RNA polymerase sigma factor [Bryobacterales bacterium]|nr:sigma-70 family RNA polymerase sigma factor [Bryobacterales bacterium]